MGWIKSSLVVFQKHYMGLKVRQNLSQYGLYTAAAFIISRRFLRVILSVITPPSYGLDQIGLTTYCKTISAVCTASAVLYDNGGINCLQNQQLVMLLLIPWGHF